MLYMNINVFKTSKSYTNKLVSVTIRNNSKILLRLPLFILLKDSPFDSHISPMTSTPVKKPSAQKSLCMFTNILEVKKKTAYRQVGGAKSKFKAIKFGNTTW